MKKSTFKTEGYELIQKTVKNHTSAGRIYVPKTWIDKKVIIIRQEK